MSEASGGDGFRSGFVAVVGRPNVGKSTLVNRLVGEKVSITSPRPQTTRGPIRGVKNAPGFQAVFVDTPGSQKPKDTLRSRMQEQVLASLAESDAIVFLLDASQAKKGIGSGDRYVARMVAESGAPSIACVNKVDLLEKRDEALPIVGSLSELGDWRETFLLSASTGLNADPLMTPSSNSSLPAPAISPKASRPTTPKPSSSQSTSGRRPSMRSATRFPTPSPSRSRTWSGRRT